MTISARDLWDGEAPTFDDEPDHGLRDPEVRAAWAGLLQPLLPEPPSRVLDLGCGTGSLSLLLAAQGHRVTGLDLSPRMLDLACEKAEACGLAVTFLPGDASDPKGVGSGYDVVLARHVVWALPDPTAALRCWSRLLAPGGRLVLVEGLWGSGAGLPAETVTAYVTAAGFVDAAHRELPDPALWGRAIDDTRYVVTACVADASV